MVSLRFSCLTAVLLAAACAPVQRVPLLSQRIALPEGRFVGPIEVKVPKHSEHGGHDFEVRVTVVARCEPLFTLAFPDGEQQPLGVRDEVWQALLRARAGVTAEIAAPQAGHPAEPAHVPTPAAQPTSQAQPAAQPASQPQPVAQPGFEPQPFPAAPPPPQPQPAPPARLESDTTIDAEARITAPTVGRWERTLTERWAGQLEFEAQRERRCANPREFTVRYRNAFDDTNTVALWAEVPQELAGGELFVEVVELVPPKVAPPPVVEAKVAVKVEAKPLPPKPAPRVERPTPAKDPGARWQPGEWVWSGRGEWVWQPGYWLRPASLPAAKAEFPGAPPVAGCRWISGRWLWVAAGGEWTWTPGRWAAPPPLVEDRGESPDSTAPWISGAWLEGGGTFTWRPGRWGRPQPRVETRPPAPSASTEWISGEWLLIQGRWDWSPGFWAGTERPPPPRAETIPPRPNTDAVWLAGFWRWDVTTRAHVWIDGHWELPPGEGYVWVEEKLGPDLILRGRWELKVRR